MAEWFKAHAWTACVAKTHRGFESLSLRQFPLPGPKRPSSGIFQDLRLFLECPIDFAVHSPTDEQRLGGAAEHVAAKPGGPVNALLQIVLGNQLFLAHGG